MRIVTPSMRVRGPKTKRYKRISQREKDKFPDVFHPLLDEVMLINHATLFKCEEELQLHYRVAYNVQTQPHIPNTFTGHTHYN